MKREITALLLAVSLAGCHKHDDKIVTTESPRVFYLDHNADGTTSVKRFVTLGVTKWVHITKQQWDYLEGEYFDGTSLIPFIGTVEGPRVEAEGSGGTKFRFQYVPGIVNYHFTFTSFEGGTMPTEDFCVETSQFCGSGR